VATGADAIHVGREPERDQREPTDQREPSDGATSLRTSAGSEERRERQPAGVSIVNHARGNISAVGLRWAQGGMIHKIWAL
jgi:hypothetical protein